MTAPLRRFTPADFPPEKVLALKGDRSVSVCIPARDERATVARVVEEVFGAAHAGVPFADDVIVVDDGSRDDTAARAMSAGARVVRLPARGKGAAMRAGLEETEGDIVVFLDADVENTGPHFVTAMVGPLLLDPDIALVKATYQRSLDGRPGEGGRVTELVAKPLIAMLFPELAFLDQPLSGECAAWRSVLEKVDFPDGYGVELATLVDTARVFGAESLAQVDLGTRIHRNRPWHELVPVAHAVIETALDRSG